MHDPHITAELPKVHPQNPREMSTSIFPKAAVISGLFVI